MQRFLFGLLVVSAVFATACSSGSAAVDVSEPVPTELAADDVVFIWTETGGCAMAGPNCARYEVTADGSVTTLRDTFEGFEEAATGQLTGDAVDAWVQLARTTRLDELQDRLGQGQVTAAFDGVDFMLEAPFVGQSISSTAFEFTPGEAYFDAARTLAQAAAEAAPLEIGFR